MAEEKESKPSPSPGPSRLNKLLFPIVAVLNLGVCGSGLYLTYMSTLGYKPPSVRNAELVKQYLDYKTKHENKPVVYTMEKFTVNLDGLPQRVLRLEVNLEMLDEEGFEEIITLGAEARDEVFRILNGKNYSDLESIQGKLSLKDQMLTALNSKLSRGVVKDVFFSDFVMQ